MSRLFGTDGVRGIAGDQLTGELAYALAQAAATWLARSVPTSDETPRMLIARDTRHSGDFLEAAVSAGLCSAGVDAVLCGVLSTPALAWAVTESAAVGGVMISASHNPAEYNGIKFVDARGFKLSDEAERTVEELFYNEKSLRASSNGLGCIHHDRGVGERYVESVCRSVAGTLAGLKVVLDCGHGAAYRLAPAVFRRLGAGVTVLNDRPDGRNINNGCGSVAPEGLQQTVRDLGAAAGLAFDGDADRVIAVDERGELVDGDAIMAICGRDAMITGRLPEDTVVATVMSNLGLDRALEAVGAKVVRTQVGDRYVLAAMLDGGYRLGGEQSGHVIFLDYATTGDGILTGLQLLHVAVREDRPLGDLAAVFKPYPQRLFNVAVEDKEGFQDNSRIAARLHEAEERLAGGRILARPSGTEPVVRIMLEGPDEGALDTIGEELARFVAEELNAEPGADIEVV